MTAPSVTEVPSRLLDRHCQELVADELTRLARRVPSLAEDHLGVVETSLRQIIDRLLPVRRRAEARPETLAALFDLEAS
ncbi:hypothetical protein NE236_29075 [Actinoallomurus purpureus]|uniref:hypothetical protein n=1 Tax=Actinoallomurus purpureus TaxID=478114 RepID=UPI0020920C80|nr:hypothetical protein [Actinoallomurus purpureus]MCO6009033.1 hypothetical protein [Actinoallomurus purpureus]